MGHVVLMEAQFCHIDCVPNAELALQLSKVRVCLIGRFLELFGRECMGRVSRSHGRVLWIWKVGSAREAVDCVCAAFRLGLL